MGQREGERKESNRRRQRLTRTGWRSAPYKSSHLTRSKKSNSAAAGTLPIRPRCN